MAELREKLIAGMRKAQEPAANCDPIPDPANHTLVVTSHDMGTANFAYFIGQPREDKSPSEDPKRFACILSFLRWILTSLDGETVPDYDQSIIKVLLKEPLIAHHRIARVYIEQQVAPDNPVMYAIASGVTTFYLVRKNDLISPHPEAIYTVNAHLKFSYFGVKCPEGKAKKPYRKKLCRQIVLYLLEQWVKNKFVHKKWLDFYVWNNKKQDDLADSFLQCYVEECKRHNIWPTWAALEALWGYIVTDKVFDKNGSCPLELTAEMDKKYASYLNRIDKEKEKAIKEQEKAKEKEAKQQQQQQQNKKPPAKRSKSSGHDQEPVAALPASPPPAPAAAAASSSSRRQDNDEIQCTPPSSAGDKASSKKTQLNKGMPVSAKARRQGLEFQFLPGPKNGSSKEQRELLEKLQKAKKDGRTERELKRKRLQEEEDELQVLSEDEGQDPSYREPEDDADEEEEAENIRRAMRASLADKEHLDQEDMLLLDSSQMGPRDLVLHTDVNYFSNDDDDFEPPRQKKSRKEPPKLVKKKKKQAEEPREEHILVQRERLALEKIEREMAAKSPGVIDITGEDNDDGDHKEAEKAPPVSVHTAEDEEFERMIQAQQNNVVIGK